jgi:hypothetical protein
MLTLDRVYSVVGKRRARAWAYAAATLVAVGCGEKFYGAEEPVGAASSAAGAEAEPGQGGGVAVGGSTSRGGSAAGNDGGGVPGGGVSGGGVSGGGVLPLGGGGTGGVIDVSPVPADGLELWFDALVGVTQENGAVSEWRDRSSYGRHALQEDGSRQPLFAAEGLDGRPALVFDGRDDVLEAPRLPGDFSAGVTLVAVGRTESNDACMGYFEASNGPEMDDVHLGFWEKHYLYEVASLYVETSVAQLLRTPEVLVGVQRASGAVQLRRNGELLTEGDLPLPVTKRRQYVYLGNTDYEECTALDGSLSELLVYSRGLTSAEVSQVEAYLKQKWGCCND